MQQEGMPATFLTLLPPVVLPVSREAAGSQGAAVRPGGCCFRTVWTQTPEPPTSHLHPRAVCTGYKLRFRSRWHTSSQRIISNSPKFTMKSTHLVSKPTDRLTVFQRCCWRPWNGLFLSSSPPSLSAAWIKNTHRQQEVICQTSMAQSLNHKPHLSTWVWACVCVCEVVYGVHVTHHWLLDTNK